MERCHVHRLISKPSFVDVVNTGQTDIWLRAYSVYSRRNQDYMSKNFERWKELSTRCLGEQDPAKLTELASEMNLLLTQKTPYLDAPQYAAELHEDGQRDALKASAEGELCFT